MHARTHECPQIATLTVIRLTIYSETTVTHGLDDKGVGGCAVAMVIACGYVDIVACVAMDSCQIYLSRLWTLKPTTMNCTFPQFST